MAAGPRGQPGRIERLRDARSPGIYPGGIKNPAGEQAGNHVKEVEQNIKAPGDSTGGLVS